jgi:hypothetical protein
MKSAVALSIVMGLSLPAAGTAATDEMSHPGLSRGRRVQIEGRVRADGAIEARRIRLRDPDDAVKIEGPVTSIDPDQRRLRIGGFDVSTTADPFVYLADGASGSVGDVEVGQIAEAKGYWSGRALFAVRLRVRPPSTGSGVPPQTEIESEIERTGDFLGGVVVLGRRVHLEPRGRVIDERSRQDPLDWTGRRLRREEDDPGTSPLRLGDWLVIGGRIGGELRSERNADHDPEEARPDRATASSELLGSLMLGRNVELYGRVRVGREYEIDDRELREIGRNTRIVEAAFAVERIAGSPIGFQVGRQRFTDTREWFLDSYLDAATVHVTLQSWRFEAAVANAIFAGPESGRPRREQRHALGSIARRLGGRASATAIVVARDDRNRGERPVWLGFSTTGRPTSGLRYWGNAAVRRGNAGSTQLRGWGIDGAGAYRFRLPGDLSISGGFATSSGDESRSDGVDTAFRQTGLEGNSARFHGIKKFAYYGEVFDPELSGIEVLTGGAGIKPFNGASIDVIYHRYRQRHARRSLPSNALDATGTGTSRELGDEIDVVVALQRFRPLDLSVVAGIFRPGPGIASPTSLARYWRPQIRLFF